MNMTSSLCNVIVVSHFEIYQTNAEREGPYMELGKLINELWPIESWSKAIPISDCSGLAAQSSEDGDGVNAIIDLSTED